MAKVSMVRALLLIFISLVPKTWVLGQSVEASGSPLSDIRGSEFSVLIEGDWDSVLFVFHQEDLLIYSDHSLFPWIGRTHTGSRFNGLVTDYSIDDMTYEQLLSDQSNVVYLGSRDILYASTDDYQAVLITNRNMVLKARNKVRRGELFSTAIISDVSWYGGVWNLIFDESSLLELASKNSFTLCSLLNDIAFFEDQGNSLRGFENKSVSDLLNDNGLSCLRNFNLVHAPSLPLPEVAVNDGRDDAALLQAASGTGFAVTSDGVLITNNHVVEGCENVKVHADGAQFDAVVVVRDPANDLAVLKADFRPTAVFALRESNPQLMQDIYVAGYPFGVNISSSVKVTKGIVSSLTGLGNNFSNIQIDAAIQPGNSGGPIFDDNGNVLGVAVSSLDIMFALENFDAIPQNTNFGIKANIVSNLLSSNGIEVAQPNTSTISTTQLGALATAATFYLSCWMTTAQIQEMSSTKVLFNELRNLPTRYLPSNNGIN